MTENKKDIDDATSAGATIGVLLGGILWWNDAVGLWGAFAIMAIATLLITGIIMKTKEETGKKQKENYIISHFESMPKPKRKVKAEKPSDNDDFDLPGYGIAIWESSKGVPINFNYVGADGKYTERTVIVHKMLKDSKTRFYFQGYCLLRKATRTFNSENIQDIYDMDGEIIEVPEFINKLAGYDAYGSTDILEISQKSKKKPKQS